MTVDIFIASWKNDIQYLDYCLRSVKRFATGFNKVVVAVAEEEERLFRPFQHRAVLKTYKRVSEPIRWQLNAQAIKCQADLFCEADFIFMMDSDCIFSEPVTPDDYFVDGKPIMLIEEFSRLPGNPWKAPTQKTMGVPVQFETMRRHGQTNHRKLLGDLRAHIEKVHATPFETYVLMQKPDFPWGFSEHCAIGAFALYDEFWKEQIHWLDLARDTRPKDKLLQCWSHSPIDKPQGTPFGLNLTPLEVFKQLGL